MRKKFFKQSLFISIASFLLLTIQTTGYTQKYLVKDDHFNSNMSTTNGTTYAIEVLNDATNKGKVLVAGFFNYYNGIYVPGKIARLNRDGSLDNTFIAPAISGGIYSIAVQPWDGKVVIGGVFTLSSGGNTYRNIVRLLTDGSVDPTFNATGGGTTNGQAGDGKITKLLVLDPERQIVVGGVFGGYKGTSIAGGRGGLIIINEAGSLVKDSKVKDGAWCGEGVYDMALTPDGKIVIAGEFGEVDGGNKARRVTRLNRDGTFDLTWNNRGYDGVGPDGTVNAVAVQSDGKIIIGGYFNNYLEYNPLSNSIERNVARVKIARLDVDGKLDKTFNYNTVSNSFLTRGFDGTVNNFLIDASGNIYVGGAFTLYDNISISTGRLAKLLPDGRLDSDFNASNFNNQVEGLAFQNWLNDGSYAPESHILAVGQFSQYSAIGNQPYTMRFYISEMPPVTLAGTLADFSVVKIGDSKSRLTWKALQATANYTVERSIDGRSFQKIATYYSANANINLTHDDFITGTQKVYYRIGVSDNRSLTVNASPVEYSNIVSVLLSSGFSTHLSLRRNELQISISSNQYVTESFHIQVLTIAGQQLLSKQLNVRSKQFNESVWSNKPLKNCLVVLTDSKGDVLERVYIK